MEPPLFVYKLYLLVFLFASSLYTNYSLNMGDDALKLENQICHRLYIASNGITRVYRPFLKKLGLTYPQYVIMMALWEKENLTMGELASWTKIDKGFLATTINKMSQSTLVEIIQDKEDLRKKHIALTSKGRKLKQKAQSIPDQIIKALKVDLPAGMSAQDLIKMLDTINSAILKYDPTDTLAQTSI